ncbi:MAG: hypothetical protein ACKOYJ_01025 [Planctomycetia bacterium]
MLHYSCDVCKRPIDTQMDVRHVVKIEVFQAVEDCTQSGCCGNERTDDANHLEEMQEMLERLDDHDCAGLLDDATVAMRFDLCDTCRQRFLRNPLGMKTGKAVGFSQN